MKLPNLFLKDEPSPMQNREARNQKQFNWDSLRNFSKGVGGFLEDAVNEVNDSVKDADDRVGDLEDRYNDQIAGATDLNEVIDARNPEGKETFATLNERLNSQISERGTSIKFFGAKCDGVTDDTDAWLAAAAFINKSKSKLNLVIPANSETIINQTIKFLKEVTITGSSSSWINAIGAGNLFEFGPNDLTIDTYLDCKRFEIKNIGLKNGEKINYGLYFNKFVTQPVIDSVNFENFGSETGKAIYFDENCWYGLVTNVRFDANEEHVREFIDMAAFGNSRIVVNNCLVHSLNGGGTAISLNGVNCQVLNCKVEGFATNVRFGDQADFSIVDNCYFEKSGHAHSGCIEIGNKDTTKIRYPQGVVLNGNYCNTHVISSDPTSFFVRPTHGAVLITNIRISNNYINNWNADQVGTPIIYLNNYPGQKGNVANNNVCLVPFGVHNITSATERWTGSDFSFRLNNPIQKDVFGDRTITENNTYQREVLDTKNSILFQEKLLSSGDYVLYLKNSIFLRAFASGRVAFGKDAASEKYDFNGTILADSFKVGVHKSYGGAGEIFEKSDGSLYYTNLKGIESKLN